MKSVSQMLTDQKIFEILKQNDIDTDRLKKGSKWNEALVEIKVIKATSLPPFGLKTKISDLVKEIKEKNSFMIGEANYYDYATKQLSQWKEDSVVNVNFSDFLMLFINFLNDHFQTQDTTLIASLLKASPLCQEILRHCSSDCVTGWHKTKIYGLGLIVYLQASLKIDQEKLFKELNEFLIARLVHKTETERWIEYSIRIIELITVRLSQITDVRKAREIICELIKKLSFIIRSPLQNIIFEKAISSFFLLMCKTYRTLLRADQSKELLLEMKKCVESLSSKSRPEVKITGSILIVINDFINENYFFLQTEDKIIIKNLIGIISKLSFTTNEREEKCLLLLKNNLPIQIDKNLDWNIYEVKASEEKWESIFEKLSSYLPEINEKIKQIKARLSEIKTPENGNRVEIVFRQLATAENILKKPMQDIDNSGKMCGYFFPILHLLIGAASLYQEENMELTRLDYATALLDLAEKIIDSCAEKILFSKEKELCNNLKLTIYFRRENIDVGELNALIEKNLPIFFKDPKFLCERQISFLYDSISSYYQRFSDIKNIELKPVHKMADKMLAIFEYLPLTLYSDCEHFSIKYTMIIKGNLFMAAISNQKIGTDIIRRIYELTERFKLTLSLNEKQVKEILNTFMNLSKQPKLKDFDSDISDKILSLMKFFTKSQDISGELKSFIQYFQPAQKEILEDKKPETPPKKKWKPKKKKKKNFKEERTALNREISVLKTSLKEAGEKVEELETSIGDQKNIIKKSNKKSSCLINEAKKLKRELEKETTESQRVKADLEKRMSRQAALYAKKQAELESKHADKVKELEEKLLKQKQDFATGAKGVIETVDAFNVRLKIMKMGAEIVIAERDQARAIIKEQKMALAEQQRQPLTEVVAEPPTEPKMTDSLPHTVWGSTPAGVPDQSEVSPEFPH
jgi:hypothetical protein